jgi:hypothetical protein
MGNIARADLGAVEMPDKLTGSRITHMITVSNTSSSL